MKTLTLVTGGIRSGKSRFALELAQARASRKTFLATAEPFDEEMKKRILRHQAERGKDFTTVEAPLHLAHAVREASRHTDLVLIDCLTLWVNNLLYRFGSEPEKIHFEMDSLLDVAADRQTDIILVTNEIGLGVIPENLLVRRFLDEQGRLNQELARISDEVIFMISGIPQVIKGVGIHANLD